MAYCSKCGKETGAGDRFCKNCGASIVNPDFDEFERKFNEFCDTADSTGEMDSADINNNKIAALISYLGILVLIPIFMAKDSKFARYHANQGLMLFICGTGYSVAMSIVTSILYAINYVAGTVVTVVLSLGSLFFVALLIIGIINAYKGLARELPIIGKARILR